jgi:hypothetical protein
MYKKDYKNEILNDSFDEIIDYNIIISKLSKNDVYKSHPTNKVISYQIHKKLRNVIEKKDDISILYIVKNPTAEVIGNICKVISDLSNKFQKTFEIKLFLEKDSTTIDVKYPSIIKNIEFLINK